MPTFANHLIKKAVLFATLCTAPLAYGAQNYHVKITNGSGMPISAGVIYVSKGSMPLTQVGNMTTAGFTRLCQMGNPDVRAGEVAQDASVVFSQKTMGPILPGQSQEVTVPVNDLNHSIHFEAMYGKTKDTCAIYNVDVRSIAATAPAFTIFGRDEVVSTGAFMDPAVAMGHDVASLCQTAAGAVDCLRTLADANMSGGQIRFFPGYLPSVLQALEQKYGAADTQSLVIPTSGAVRFEVVQD